MKEKTNNSQGVKKPTGNLSGQHKRGSPDGRVSSATRKAKAPLTHLEQLKKQLIFDWEKGKHFTEVNQHDNDNVRGLYSVTISQNQFNTIYEEIIDKSCEAILKDWEGYLDDYLITIGELRREIKRGMK